MNRERIVYLASIARFGGETHPKHIEWLSKKWEEMRKYAEANGVNMTREEGFIFVGEEYPIEELIKKYLSEESPRSQQMFRAIAWLLSSLGLGIQPYPVMEKIGSLIESDRWDWVQTEDGFTFHLQPNGTWDDGDMVFDHCPTDGFFMHNKTKRVVQLKACQQKANGLFQLGEIRVSADDMWALGYRELDGHPGYVGDRPSENE